MPSTTRSKGRSPMSSPSSSFHGDNEDAQNNAQIKPSADSMDKENLEKSAFRPPSPLTSKRSRGKNTDKRVLSPNRKNEWSQSSSSSRQPRASPIQASSRQDSYQKDRDPREGSRNQRQSGGTLKREIMSAPSFSAELDLMKSDEDFGADLDDCLNLGSFGEDSPLRPGYPRRSPPRSSPPNASTSGESGGYSYRGMPSSAYPINPPSFYAGTPYGHSGYHLPPYAEHPPWASPRTNDYDRPYPHSASKTQPHSREYEPLRDTRLEASPLSKKSRRWDRDQTPEKQKARIRSPFRSPMSNQGSAKKFKRSPIWGGGGTPNIGMYGSFGMADTPGAHLDGFSPLGPSFTTFDNDSPSFPLEGEVLDARLSLVGEEPSDRVPLRQRQSGPLPKGSPGGFRYIGESSQASGSMPPDSPVRMSTRDRDPPRHQSEKDQGTNRAPPVHLQPPVKRSAPSAPTEGTASKRLVYASPMVPTQPGAPTKRAPWYDHSSQAPAPFRLQLGDPGVKASETRKSLEGINSMVRGGGSSTKQTPASQPANASTAAVILPPKNTPANPAPPAPPRHPGEGSFDTNRSSVFRDSSTPAKVRAGTVPATAPRPVPTAPVHPVQYPPSGHKPTVIPMSAPRYPVGPSGAAHPPPGSSSRLSRPFSSKESSSRKKEKTGTPVQQRRHPCNCKKSKCLKLYCECFACELYCDGCNCVDCRNTKQHEGVRSKAMKDTKAKNPNAFKPRIASRGSPVGPVVGTPPSAHSMGCRCKRSECLKKYCECFQAGVMCSNKCKCVECLNYVGSQALIDKRRKIKDHRGADFAMRIADEAWKGKHNVPPPGSSGLPTSAPRGRGRPSLSPPIGSSHPHHPHQLAHHMPPIPPHLMHSSPGHHHPSHVPRGPPPGAAPRYMGHPQIMMGHPHMGYSMPPASAPYPHAMQHSSLVAGNRSSEGSRQKRTERAEQRTARPKFSPSSQDPIQSDLQVKPTKQSSSCEESIGKGKDDILEGSPESKPHLDGTGESKVTKLGSVALSVPSEEKDDELADTVTPSAIDVKPPYTTPAPSKQESVDFETTETTVAEMDTLRAPPPAVTPNTVTKREDDGSGVVQKASTKGIRLGYDPYSSKRKRKLSPGQDQETFTYFGELPKQPKTTALAIFSFLSNDDIYNAGLVSNQWSQLAMDEELWQF